jgi:hypothetical protein
MPTPSSGARSPLVSLVLAVKNAMPQVRQAMEALQRQSYRNFEIVVQDGASTDGTLEYLSSVNGLPQIEIVSEPDRGIGQAYNRGLARSKGDIVCFAAADEWLDDDALEKGVQWLLRHPNAAAVYGGVRMIDASGRLFQVFIPPPFDWTKVIRNEMAIPMAAAFLNRKRIGSDLYYDESLKTCPDYDFWLRVGSKCEAAQCVLVPEPILTARADRASMSFRAESFPQFTEDKLFVLNRYLSTLGEGKEVAALRATASAGILTWAAENVLWLEGVSPEFLKSCREAARFDPFSARLAALARRSEAFQIGSSGQFTLEPPPQPKEPEGPARRIDGVLKPEEIRTEAWWEGAQLERGPIALVTTAAEPGSYAALIPLASANQWRPDYSCNWYWVKLDTHVVSGEIGISLFEANNIHNERTVSSENGRMDVFIRMSHPEATGVMVRNGSRHGQAVVEIFGGTVECAPKASFSDSGE